MFIFSGACLAQSSKNKDSYVLGLLSTQFDYDPDTLTEVFEPYLNYMNEKTGITIRIKMFSNTDLMIKAFKENQIQLGNISNIDYVKIKKQVPTIIPIARKIKAGSSKYKTVLIVRKDSPYKTLADLKGKSYAYTFQDSPHGYIVPSLIIRKQFKMPLEKFFGKIMKVKKDSDAVLALYYKKVDAIYTYDSVLNYFEQANPGIIKNIKVLESYEPLYYGSIVYLENGFKNKKDIELIKHEILTMGSNIKGKQLLLVFKVSGWDESKDSDYDSLRNLINKLK